MNFSAKYYVWFLIIILAPYTKHIACSSLLPAPSYDDASEADTLPCPICWVAETDDPDDYFITLPCDIIQHSFHRSCLLLHWGNLIADNVSATCPLCNSCFSLSTATHGNHLDLLKLLLDAGENVDAFTEEGATALHYAAEKGHNDVAKLLLARGANTEIYATDSAGISITPLHIAAEIGHRNVTDTLLAAEAYVDARIEPNEGTALQLATLHGHLGIVIALLKAGADKSAESAYGHTAYSLALLTNNLCIITLLKSWEPWMATASNEDIYLAILNAK